MAKSTVTILVNGKWSGDGLESAANSLARLGKVANTSAKDAAKALGRLDSDAKKYQAQIASTSASTSKSLMDSADTFVTAGARIYQTSDKIAGIGKAITTGVTVPMVAIGLYASKAAVEYDTAMADLRKTSDLTASELERMGESARELSTTQPVTASQILSIDAMGAQLGIANESLESFAKTVSGLEIATNMDADTAATEMARFKNIVGMADEDMQRYGSTIVAIGNNMATTESETSQMAMRLASAGHQAGMSSSEILGLSAAMSSLGVKAEMGGSALSQVFIKISNAVTDGGAALEAFASRSNMTSEEFASSWKENAAGAFTELLRGINDSVAAGEDMNAVLGELGISQIRSSDVMRRMAGSVDVVTDAIDLANSAWEQNTALQAEVDKRNESMASRLQVLKNKVDDVAITVGVPLVNAAIEAIDAAQPLIECVGDMADAFASMDEDGQRHVLMLAAMAAGAGPASTAVGTLGKGVADLVTGLGHGMHAVGVFSDALRTVDGSQVRAYSSLSTLEAQLGVTNNAVVRAAGGVERYVGTWEAWYDATKSLPAIEEQLGAAIAENEKLVVEYGEATGKSRESLAKKVAVQNKNIAALEKDRVATKAARDENKKLLDSWTDSVGAQRVSIDATAEQTDGMKRMGDAAKLAGSKVAGIAKGLAASAGATIALAALGAAISAIADDARRAKERQDLLNDSSKTFGDVARMAADGATSQAEAIDDLASSVGETMRGIVELNEKAGEAMADAEVNAATLDTYVATIKELGAKSSLTATEQERLTTAVNGYSEITGDSVSVSYEAGVQLSKTTDEINRNAEAWKRNAKAQAMRELAVEYTKQQAKAQLELTKATDAANKASAEYDRLSDDLLEKQRSGVTNLSDERQAVMEAAEARKKANDTLADAAHNYESASKSMDELTRMQVLNSEACQWLIETLSGMDSVVVPLEAAGVSIEGLSVKLADAGYSADQMAEMGPKIAELAVTFNGNVDSMVWALQNYNNVPMVDKDGNVTVDDESLIDAYGNVWTWNVTGFESKTASALVNDAQLVDAQGRVYTWNGSHLELLSTETKVDSSEVQQDIDRTKERKKGAPKNLRADTSIDSSSTQTDIDRTKWRKNNPPADQSATTTITRYENVVKLGGATMATGGYRFHADGGIATRATVLTRDIVGEAGAEAIVPLTNRRYAMPFVRMIADETVKSSRSATVGGNVYNLHIDGMSAVSMSARQEELLQELVDSFCNSI